jgi:hypothetical membrane protein
LRRVSLLSSALAPILLIGGWTVAAWLQPAGYSSIRQTISELAGRGATDRWLMTAALVGLGLCHIVTAYGLGAAPAGRFVHMLGGLATLGVAAFALPAVGSSGAHTLAASIAFGSLAVWPALGWRRHSPVWGLRPAVAIPAAVVLLLLVAWFAVTLWGTGESIGLSERVAAGAQALWPFVVVVSARSSARGAGTGPLTPDAGLSTGV